MLIPVALLSITLLAATSCSDDSAAQVSPLAATAEGGPGVSTAAAGIAVVGKGEIKGRPDSLTIEVGVSARRASVEEATRDASVRSQAVMEALSAGGVPDDDIQTRNLAVHPHWEHPPNGQPRIAGYVFTQTVAATLRDLDTAGSVIDAALAAGGDDAVLHGVTFALDDDTDAVAEARAAAFADARTKAEQLAQLAGASLGAAQAIEETLTGPPPGAVFATEQYRAAADGDLSIAPGQVTTTVVVSIRFALG